MVNMSPMPSRRLAAASGQRVSSWRARSLAWRRPAAGSGWLESPGQPSVHPAPLALGQVVGHVARLCRVHLCISAWSPKTLRNAESVPCCRRAADQPDRYVVVLLRRVQHGPFDEAVGNPARSPWSRLMRTASCRKGLPLLDMPSWRATAASPRLQLATARAIPSCWARAMLHSRPLELRRPGPERRRPARSRPPEVRASISPRRARRRARWLPLVAPKPRPVVGVRWRGWRSPVGPSRRRPNRLARCPIEGLTRTAPAPHRAHPASRGSGRA